MSKSKCQIKLKVQMPKRNMIKRKGQQNLERRLLNPPRRTIPQNPINNNLVGQIVRSGTSIGANYMEADAAESKKDFKHKISICKKESKETKHWLRMIAKANPTKLEESRVLWKEAQELTLIFSSILRPKNKE